MATLGLAPARPAASEDDVLVVPDVHIPVWEVWCASAHDWHHGFSGMTGIIKSEVRATAQDDFGIPREKIPSLMRRIRIMESAAIAEFGRQAAAARASR